MRRLITYINSLFLGMILGMIFVAIFHARPADRQETVRANRSALVRLILRHRDIGFLR